MVIGIDFDGTCTTNAYPKRGRDIGAGPVIQELVESGHDIVLYTMRSTKNGVMTPELQIALDWFEHYNIPLFGINNNPSQDKWAPCSRKIYCDLYIDDLNAQTKVIKDTDISSRHFVDWLSMFRWLKFDTNIITTEKYTKRYDLYFYTIVGREYDY